MGATKIPLANSDNPRLAAREAQVLLRNRYVEQNSVLSDNSPSFISRPGLRYFLQLNGGTGPVRAIFQEAGAFSDDLFAVAYNSLFRVKAADGTSSLISDQLSGGDVNNAVRLAATGDIGTIPPRLWIADGVTLFLYTEDGFAHGTLTLSSQAADGDIVQVGSVYYRLTASAGALDTGSPAGTSGNPWRVLIGPASIIQTTTNLFNAINATGTPGTDYSTALTTANADAIATDATANALYVRAVAASSMGNSVVTTETGANMAWGGGTLSGGGSAGIIPVVVPDDLGVQDICVIGGYVIVIPAQGQGVNGRFYWIRPGETVIDPLDYATAERSPDPIFQCVVFNDSFWLAGQSTTEVWYLTGDDLAPVLRQQGIVFDRGTIPGGTCKVKDSLVMIDPDGGVFQIQGAAKRISTPAIENVLRVAINYGNIHSG